MADDIRPRKALLRSQAIKWREGLSKAGKQQIDFKIQTQIQTLWIYRNARTVLVYCAKDLEIDTKFLIERSWKAGKIVAAPRCVPGTSRMEFYRITDFSQLEKGAFGVMEPKPADYALIRDFSDSVCIVPALACDKQGHRLGYGKGYYDRFLSAFGGKSICPQYSQFVMDSIPCGKFDRKVDMIITEKEKYFCNTGDKNGR